MTEKSKRLTDLYVGAVLLADRDVFPYDCWEFLTQQANTLDEATQSVKPFPPYDYLHDLIDVLNSDFRVIAIPKSRRMFVTWAVALWVWWLTRYHEGHFVIWQSLTEEKAAEILDTRIIFAEEHIRDQFLKREYEPYKTREGLVGRMKWNATGSRILAAAQGPHVFRSFTPSVAIIDECDFQPEAYSALDAAIPLAEKNAKLILISTSNGPNKPIADICMSFGMTRYGQVTYEG